MDEGFFQLQLTKKKRFCIESNFSRIYMDLPYSPIVQHYYPSCYITLCELGRDAMDALDAKDSTRPGFYNLITFNTGRIANFFISNHVHCLCGENSLYCEEELETLLKQLRLIVFPAIRECLTRDGFIMFCQKFHPSRLGMVYKSMGEWINSNVPNVTCSWDIG